MEEEFLLIRWKLIIAVTVGLIFAVFAAFLVLAILVCRQKSRLNKRRKEMQAERLNRRQWLVEQNTNLINQLFHQFQPVDSSIPLPRTHPSAFLESMPEDGSSQNGCSLTSRGTGESNQMFHHFQRPSTHSEMSLPSSKVAFQHKSSYKGGTNWKKKGSHSCWVNVSSSQFDSIGSATPSLHRIPERTFKESSEDRGTLFEGDSGYSHMELSDVNHNSSLAGSDWYGNRGTNPVESMRFGNPPHASYSCKSHVVQKIDRAFPVI